MKLHKFVLLLTLCCIAFFSMQTVQAQEFQDDTPESAAYDDDAVFSDENRNFATIASDDIDDLPTFESFNKEIPNASEFFSQEGSSYAENDISTLLFFPYGDDFYMDFMEEYDAEFESDSNIGEGLAIQAAAAAPLTSAEYSQLRIFYADLNLAASMSTYNVIVLGGTDLTEANLRSAITTASATTKSDLIVLRTSASYNTIPLSGTEINIDVNATSHGSVFIVALPDNSGLYASMNGLGRSRIFYTPWRTTGQTDLRIGGLLFGNAYSTHVNGGGAIHNGGKMFVSQCAFVSNVTTYSGGGIQNHGELTVAWSSFLGNQAESGGAIDTSNDTFARIYNCDIGQNVVTYRGGGIRHDNSNNECLIAGCFVYGNLAESTGGGIWNQGRGLRIVNCSIDGNYAYEEGGGVFNYGSGNIEILQSTIAGNMAGTGGGIRCYRNTTMKNSIVAGNIAATGKDIWAQSNTSPSAFKCSYSLIENYTSGVGRWFVNDGQNVLDRSPLFNTFATYSFWNNTRWQAWDLRLRSSSPAVNKGNTADASGIVYDVQGNPRVVGSRVDMGAYEYQ